MADEFADDDLQTKFTAAADYLPSLVSSLKSDILLQFYGLYKQATVGKCDTSSPYWYAYQSKQKWDAWKRLGDLSQEEAMKKYLYLLDEVCPDWEDQESKKENWVSVSSMHNEDSDLDDEDKSIFDHVKEGDLSKVEQYLKTNDINVLDEFGMGFLHWAADRGLKEMVQCLLDAGADINGRDSSGQTALHYACSCSHSDIVQILLSKGAKTDLICEDGFTPQELANENIKDLFKSASFQ